MSTNKTSSPHIKLIFLINYLIGFCILFSCHGATDTESGKNKEEEVHSQTPVTLVQVDSSAIAETIQLNATTHFIKKNQIRSTSSGYIQKISIQLGDLVQKGQTLLVIKTKEATALGNSIFPKDSSLQFSGIIPIRSSNEGYINGLSHQIGDFVQEGDALCEIVDENSLVFMIEVPFEWSRFVNSGMNCFIKLSDGRLLKSTILKRVSFMDQESQTETYMAKVNTKENIPENLNAKVIISKPHKGNSLTLPKSSILSNEEETEFWVMKLVNDSLAVKIPIKKGIENEDRVEILGGTLKIGDSVVSTGNYGLTDSAAVHIQP